MIWLQQAVVLAPRPRGFHLVTHEIVAGIDGLEAVRRGMMSLFIQHTSASLAINENASPDVRDDLETWFDRAVPEGFTGWTHTHEGPDDMPAHVKAVLLGSSLSVPVRDGTPWLGTWQGIVLCEHRDRGGPRQVAVTVWGEDRDG